MIEDTKDERSSFAPAFSWGQDFWRAFHERHWLLRWIAFAAMGRYAVRELVGMRDAIEEQGYSTHYPYDETLKQMAYHQEEIDKWS